MNILLWACQIFLAIAFLYSGINKSILSERQLIARGQTGVVGYSPAAIHLIGVAEILGSIGIIVPWWTGILSWLTPVAASAHRGTWRTGPSPSIPAIRPVPSYTSAGCP